MRVKVRSTWTTRLLFVFAAVTAAFLALWSARERAQRDPPRARSARASGYVVEVELADESSPR